MNTSTKLLLALVSLVIGNTYAAEANSRKDRECLFANQPQSWQVLDQRQLILWGPSSRDAYLVTLFSPIQDLSFAETLAFIDGDHNGMICGYGTDKIAVPGSNLASFPAIIASMQKLNDAELVALGEKYKIKLISDKKAQEIKRHDKQIHTDPVAP